MHKNIDISKKIEIVLVILISTISCFSVFAGGVAISPASFSLENMPIGEDTDLGVDLVVFNKGKTEAMFQLTPMKTSAQKAGNLGYDVIPDPAWFYFKNNKVKVGANSQASARMYLNIPKDEKYYNQHWMVNVMVKPVGGSMFQMGLSGVYMIETAGKGNLKVKPAGKLGFAPSVFTLDDYTPPAKATATYTIYNNDNVDHTYRLKTEVFPKKTKLQIAVSPGFQWIEDLSWVKPVNDAVTVKAGASKEFKVDVEIPMGKAFRDEGWEAVILVSSEKNDKGFVRLKIQKSNDKDKK